MTNQTDYSQARLREGAHVRERILEVLAEFGAQLRGLTPTQIGAFLDSKDRPNRDRHLVILEADGDIVNIAEEGRTRFITAEQNDNLEEEQENAVEEILEYVTGASAYGGVTTMQIMGSTGIGPVATESALRTLERRGRIENVSPEDRQPSYVAL